MPRSAVAIVLPHPEFVAVRDQLVDADIEGIAVESAAELEQLLSSRTDVHAAILDGETNFDRTLEMYGVLHAQGRNIPALLLLPPRSIARMGLGAAEARDEYFTRPYSAESLRWRVEAMLIRVEREPEVEGTATALVGGEGASALEGPGFPAYGDGQAEDGHKRGKIVIVFNPKGGVGKTTISINLGAALELHRGQRVLLVDCDTVSGHIASSLGLERPRTLASAWREDAKTGVYETVAQIASVHSGGLSVLVMSESPLHTEALEPGKVAAAIIGARESYDWVILDMHPDYGPLNQALFAGADRVLVPVTPDVPCIRAAVQFREVAEELQIQGRLLLVINRSNSGVAASDVERVVGLPALGRVRSAGMVFVHASDEGKSAVERYPTEKVIGDIDTLADRLMEEIDLDGGDGSGLPPGGRITGSVKGFFDRITA